VLESGTVGRPLRFIFLMLATATKRTRARGKISISYASVRPRQLSAIFYVLRLHEALNPSMRWMESFLTAAVIEAALERL
jgi:hypothetical protein